jgi:hypothetical protein
MTTRCLFFLLLLPFSTHADTVVFRDDTSLNGTVEFNGNDFCVMAQFTATDNGHTASGPVTKRLCLPAQTVKLVRLNTRTDNSGPSPLGEGRIRSAVGEIRCQIVIATTPRPVSGVLDLIQPNKIVVDGKEIKRKDVVSIRLLLE